MNGKGIAIKQTAEHGNKLVTIDQGAIIGSLIFAMAFILLAYILGNADVAANPYVPSRIL